MADYDYVHLSSVMEAAMPHIDPRTRSTLDVMTKMFALLGSLRNLSKSNMAACGYEAQKTDLEGLLSSIRPRCFGKELAFVDQILSMFQAKRMFETYKTVMETMKTMQGFEGSPFGDMFNQKDGEANSDQGGGFDYSAFFNGFQSNSEFKDDGDPESNEHEFKNDEHSEQEYGEHNYEEQGYEDHEHNNKVFEQESQEHEATKQGDIEGDDSKQNGEASKNSNNNMNMLNMLKEMIPPDQRSTFENLSMLFNTMSYDNNKPDQNKEN